ncbi:WYL domain-containing protein [Thermomonas sp.]|uniref:WYL domain-containing protein n=1 Tax=Thermomonas sp. TaxID=1971895 RepID=UPI002609A324|nr:WYL domain-containing protein [Thermomonas sp.]
MELSATVDDDQTLLWWLLGFGENVEVREPRSLRDEIGLQLRAAAGRYVGS